VRTVRSAQAVFAKLQGAVTTLPVSLRFLAHVPDDQNVRRAAMLRRPLVDLAPTSPASRAFERITDLLLSVEPQVSSGVTPGLAQQLGIDSSSPSPRPARPGPHVVRS
jgi:MinD-like ATPase involved in chromosome partitioning or flagellar assembly